MDKDILQVLKDADLTTFGPIYRGLEKENMRVDRQGAIAQTAHPKHFGAKLTNAWITTDFSESLVEVVTPVATSLADLKKDIAAVTQFCSTQLGDELFWPASMPGHLDETQILLADYGKNNSGRMKKVYRHGLAERYGKIMQMIAGIHYNVSFSETLLEKLWRYDGQGLSFSEYSNQRYMGLVRNFFRYGWLLPYLFGASPIASASSVKESFEFLEPHGEDFIGRYATSLRLSRLGYQNKGKSLMQISYDSVTEYANSILQATKTPYPPFSKLGIKNGAGYIQLNDALLQIENEYYSPMRPKQPAERCKRPVASLLEKGVRYIELRALDLNPFEPLGFEQGQLEFTDLFLLFCLLKESPALNQEELQCAESRLQQVAEFGRKPGLELSFQGKLVALPQAGEAIFDALLPIAECLGAIGEVSYLEALTRNRQKLTDVNLTPSAQLINEFLVSGKNYTDYILAFSEQHRRYWQECEVDEDRFKHFVNEAEQSLQAFAEIESSEQIPFEEYLSRYFQQG